MAVNDSGLQYRHPHVTANINSEEVIYDSGESTTSFFYAAVTEKGVDNKIQRLSSSAEFINKFGQPNMKKYGQAAYNIINLLDAGAEVYLLRVLPNDASYAHAFLNVQTLVNNKGKKVETLDGSIAEMDDVYFRLNVAYSELSSTSADSLRNELLVERTSKTIDGYYDNLLLCMYPIGRGKAYNNMAFRLTLNSSYDEMYEFRVYTLEVITYDEFGVSNIIEGPFYVSLDPEAMGANNESMFIVDVLERYSKTVRCLFNEKVYDKLTQLINPDVNPSHIDILSGQSRIIGGQKETFYSSVTKKNEDVHIALQKYDITGQKVLENGYIMLNYADANDKSVQTSVDIDNALRRDIYDTYKNMLNTMSTVLGQILQGNYNKSLANLITTENNDGDLTLSGGSYSTELDSVTQNLDKALKTIFTDGILPGDSVSASNVNPNGIYGDSLTASPAELSTADSALALQFEKTVKELERIIPYLRMIITTTGTTTTVPVIESNINKWKEKLNGKESFLYDVNEVYRKILDLSDQLIFAETIIDVESKAEAVIAVFSEYMLSLLPVIELLNNRLSPKLNFYKALKPENGDEVIEVHPYDDAMAEINKLRDSALGIIETISNEYLTNEFIDSLLKDTYELGEDGQPMKDETGNYIVETPGLISIIADEFDKTLKFIDMASPLYAFSVDYDLVNGHSKQSILGLEFKQTLLKAVDSATNEYDKKFLALDATSENKKKIVDDAKAAIEEEKVQLENLKSTVLKNVVQNATSISKFSGGTDGNIDADINFISTTERQTNINKLLVQAYKGLIDNDVTNSQLMRFKYLLDANYSLDVKNAMVSLVREIRQDLFVWLDTEFCNSPEETVSWRVNKFPISTQFAGIYAQNMMIFDEFQGKDTKVSMSYFLAKKIPQIAKQYGLHYPIAGSRRGIVDGYKENSVSFYPNKLYKEQLYNRQINYLETDGVNTKIGAQLTADSTNTPLSNINNVLTILDIKRNVTYMAESVIFEFNDEETKSAFQQELNNYLDKYVSNRACENISATVYASDYDKQQKILRVSISIKFNDVIERVIINLDVLK